MSWEIWLQVIGWVGSAVLVFSVLQSKFLRFRILNGIASLVLVAYNALLGSWPQVAMNAVLVLIDAYFLVRLLGEQRAEKAFTYVQADPRLRQWFFQAHRKDILAFHPDFADQVGSCEAELLFHQDRAIGLVAFTQSDDQAELLADYVVPAYRDYAPGAFVYSAAGPLVARGIGSIPVATAHPAVVSSLTKMGYVGGDGVYTKRLAPAQAGARAGA